MIILGVDYGKKRIGLAVSDPLGIAAHGLDTIESQGVEGDAAAVAKLAREQEDEEIVVGLPVNMDGTEGPQAEVCRDFADKLRARAQRPVHLVDERMSSQRAEKALADAGLNWRKRKKKVDRMAAQFILESHLQTRRM